MNVALKPEFSQVCVWQSTNLGGKPPEDFEKWFESEFGVPAQFLEVIETRPDFDEDFRPVDGTGGRTDLFFAVRGGEDCAKIAVKRLMYGIRWIEDAISNGDGRLYPERVLTYRSW